jgi:hypothetical protein
VEDSILDTYLDNYDFSAFGEIEDAENSLIDMAVD